jgi:hypothetical protein
VAGGTVGTHIDESTLLSLNAVAELENRPKSQLMATALRTFLELPPGARRVMFTVDGLSSQAERAFVMKYVGRAALKAYERVVDARHSSLPVETTGNAALDTEEAIDEEAVRLCRM